LQLKMIHKALIGLAFIASIAFIFIPTIASFAENVNYIYDNNNRLIRVEYGDGRVVEYAYDEVGNLLQRGTSGPKISVTPSSYDFGSVNVGSTSSPNTFTITNTGTLNLVIGTITSTNASEFIKQNDNCSSLTITPSSSCTVRVVFSPISAGPKTADLSIPSNDPDTPTLIRLSGTGTYPTLKLIAPNGGEVIPSGSTYTVQWVAPTNAAKFDLKYAMNGTALTPTWKLIANKVPGSSYNWIVFKPTANKMNCLAKVIAYNASGVKVGEDISDNKFTIEVVKVISPNGGETLKSGTPHTILWRTNGTKNPVAKAELSYTTGGGIWKPITTLTSNPGSYNWTVPIVPSTKTKCKVKVVLKNSSGGSLGNDVSDTVFTIQP